MFKLVCLCTALFVANNSAVAEWTQVGSSATSIVYIDKDSAKSTGTSARILGLTDYRSGGKTPSGAEYLSSKDLYEFDCPRNEYRHVERGYFSGATGQGKLVYVYKPTASVSSYRVEANTPSELVLNIACKIKQSAPGTVSISSDDRCASWGLKHGTAEYADCQIKLLQVNKSSSPEPARTTPSQQTTVTAPARSAAQKESDANECESWAKAQPNPYTAKVSEYKGYVYGSPKSYSYSGATGSGRTYSGTITEDPDFSRPSGFSAGMALGKFRVDEENYARQIAMRCMQDKGYRLK